MNANQFILKNVRVSFPCLDTPRPSYGDQGEPKYSCNFIISKDDEENLKVLRTHLKRALIEKFGSPEKLPIVLRKANLDTYLSAQGKDGWPVRDGDLVDREGYENSVFIKTTTKNPPFILDTSGKPMLPNNIYAGCYVIACLSAWAYDRQQQGVAIGLAGVRFVSDGEAFGAGAAKASSYFDDLPSEDSGVYDVNF